MANFSLNKMSVLAIGRRAPISRNHLSRLRRQSHERFIMICLIGSVFFIGWAAIAHVDQVTSAQGKVVLSQKNQIVQHLEGGILDTILVKEGDRVSQGDPLVVIRDARWKASAKQASLDSQALIAKRIRLEAESSGIERLDVPSEHAENEAMALERRVFHQRKSRQRAQIDVLREQLSRSEIEREELQNKMELIKIERAFVSEKAERLTQMAQKGAISRNDQLSALIELQRIDTQMSEIKFRIPQLQAKINESNNKIAAEVLKFRAEAREELAKTILEIAKIDEQIATLDDRADRAYVRAPTGGVVNTLYVTTAGGVVREGQPIAEIVPDSQGVLVEIEVQPQYRAKIRHGMPGIVKVTAYDFGAYGGIRATVAEISADSLTDEKGQSYFRVVLRTETDEIFPGEKILPGMAVEVDMVGEPRTILSFLMTPLRRTMTKAFQ